MSKLKQLTLSFLLSFFFFIFTGSISAQQSFRYQAVARDSAGIVISNQEIGVQISIIQTAENLPPIYQETHQVTSNDYGVLNLNVGEGNSTLGVFNEIDWSLQSFLQVEIDINGGSNYDLNNLSEILSVPRALYADRAKSFDGERYGLYVTNFGATGDGSTDDTDAFEQALDSAAILGCKVFVPHGIYVISRTLVIKDGVSLIGEGAGSDPLQTPYNGSLLWFYGNDYAIKMIGHNTTLKDLVIRDKNEAGAAGGILVEADGRLVESVFCYGVLISGFTKGIGLHLSAKNSGGIAYASFNELRIRHGLIGLHINEEQNSFINSNTWNHCQISGGGFKHGVLVDGGNHNIFKGVIVEPPSSTHGHFVVSKGEITGTEIRIEGVHQDDLIPLIKFDKKTKNSTLTGIYAGGLTLDKGNNFINMKSGKAIHYRNSSYNKFRNATFFSPDGQTVPDWEVTGNNVQMEILAPSLSETHNIIKLTVPAGITARVEPSALARPLVKDLPLYDQVNFGFYIKTNVPGVAYTYTNASKGWTRSNPHCGSDDWEFVGMNAESNRNQPARFAAQVENTTGSSITVYISTPTLCFGNQLPTLDEKPLLSSGGQLHGLLIDAVASSTIPSNGYLDLPQTANYFEVTNSNNIARINHQTANRFPKGSILTLLFDMAGVGVTNGAYIQLKSGFTSVANSSLTLMSNGNGTWREVNRNN